METIEIKDEASVERERQRSDSEARDIIHDLDRLYTFPEERKTRWVWELLQNAKDVANPKGVDIHFKLSSDRLEFSHNGLPFYTKHLLAILYKTSTKSLGGEDGTTGKYGTGFVTTHILSKKLRISGVHENNEGKRFFTLEIDRTAASLDESKALAAMKESLSKTFEAISQIARKPPEVVQNEWHSFNYPLNVDSYVYAKRGLVELEKNLAFTLLINPNIKSVTIETVSDKNTFIAIPEDTQLEGVNFVSVGSETGLLYHQSDRLVFGIPATKQGGSYRLLPVQDQAVLFKEFPLVGTEHFNLPVLIQHKDFHPTELRDGVRTKITSKDEEDPVASKNRQALLEFVQAYIPFIKKLIANNIGDIYLFAKSGLPAFIEKYSNIEWYQEHIQKPIREFILQEDVVQTCSGSFIKIAEAKFFISGMDKSEALYLLAAKLVPDQIPSQASIWQWSEIIAQDASCWPNNTTMSEEELVKLVPEIIDLEKETSFEWLKELYQYLDNNKLTYLGEENPIYPNEAKRFCVREKVAIHPHIDDEFKIVSAGLGRPLDEEFLNRKIGKIPAIKAFDLTEFYNYLNKELISELKVETATPEQIQAVFHVCCLFRSDKAFKREHWFKIINQLRPELAPAKKLVTVDYEYYWRSAELWSIKYICYLIEKAVKPSTFSLSYFEGHEPSCFEWLNDFIGYIFGLPEESRDIILKRSIIPSQIDEFKPYDELIFAEKDSKYFDDNIKNIFRDYTGQGDPRRFIIDKRVAFEGLRLKEVDMLTREIDKLFQDDNIESKVKKGGSLNEMFLQLNNWFEQHSNAAAYLHTFSIKRASLYVLALGEGFSKQIMEIQSSGKSIDDITELAKIKLSPQEMKLFEAAAVELGTNQLLAKAQEMMDAKQQVERWKTIGTAAETAFREALAHSEPSFEILNPDLGKDFVILLNGKEYAIEIKSVDALKGNVNMSLLQGKTAVLEKGRYALAVLTRPDDDQPVDKNYFMKVAKFVPDIGCQIGDSIEQWSEGLRNLDTNADVKVSLDDKTESVYISRNIWKSGISFDEFIGELKSYFVETEEALHLNK